MKSSFTISENLDKNKVFIVNRSEIEGRFDPQYYHTERRRQIDSLKKSQHKLLPLNEVVEFSKNISIGNSNVVYVGLEDIESNTGIYYSNSEKETFGTALQFSKENILFPKLRPYLNKIHFAEFNGVCSTEFAVLKVKEMLMPKFLSAFLRSSIVLNQVKHMMSGNTLPRLQTEDVRNLLIPIPIYETQEKIVQIMDNAYLLKKQNEAEAEKLLVSIDDYLLDELGIKLPTQPENSLKNRTFYTSLKEISGGRFDPFYSQQEFVELDKILNGNLFIEFSSIIEVITKGETPLWKGESYCESGIPFLKVQNISTSGIFGDITYISEELHKSMKRSILRGGELLYTMAGSIGLATFFPKHLGEANINQAIAKIVLKSNVKIDELYLLFAINSVICQKQAKRFLTVAAQPNINFDQIKKIKIPLPPLPKQQEIASHITQIRNQAQLLKEQANIAIKQANQEIEQILIIQRGESGHFHQP